MLFIGDIHATPRLAQHLYATIRTYILSHPPQDVIFLGDIVYQFSYNRKVIVDFYMLLQELHDAGYTIHVLAGNHDRIANHYIFHELATVSTTQIDMPHFYQTPCVVEIEGYQMLMLPRTTHLPPPPGYSDEEQNTQGLHQSSMIDKRLSFMEQTYTHFLCAHHYYTTASTAFPGTAGLFQLHQGAVDKKWLNYPHARLFSGHIHHGFAYKNYCCAGAIRQVSQTDVNRVPVFLSYDPTLHQLTLTPHIYPGRQCSYHCDEHETQITATILTDHINAQINKSLDYRRNSVGDMRQVATTPLLSPLNHQDVSLTLEHDTLSYQEITTVLDATLHETLHATIVKKNKTLEHALASLHVDQQELAGSLHGRQSLLIEYISKKYPDTKETYLSTLNELKIV